MPTPTAAQTANGMTLARDVLQEFDLPDSLLTFLSTEAINGATPDELIASLYARPEFQHRFPAIAARAKAGLPAISPADYLNYERTAVEAFSKYNMPLPRTGQAFHDIIDHLISTDVSAEELVNDRIAKAWAQVEKAPAEVRAAGEKAFGVAGDAVLAGQLLDPTVSGPEIQRMADGIMIAGTGTQYGFTFSRQRAMELAHTDAASHLSDFERLAEMKPLFEQNVGETQNQKITAEDQGAAAIFGEPGTGGTEVARTLAERKAELSGAAAGGQVLSSTGVLGLRTADKGTDR